MTALPCPKCPYHAVATTDGAAVRSLAAHLVYHLTVPEVPRVAI